MDPLIKSLTKNITKYQYSSTGQWQGAAMPLSPSPGITVWELKY